MDDIAKFNSEKLPSKVKFYNIINNEDITSDDYKHARNIRTDLTNTCLKLIRYDCQKEKVYHSSHK